MVILTPGHRYIAANHEDATAGQTIQFIEKKPIDEGYAWSADTKTKNAALQTVLDGTTTEELIRIIIDRLLYLNKAFPGKENACAITHQEESLMWLEKRTRDRMARGVEGMNLK